MTLDPREVRPKATACFANTGMRHIHTRMYSGQMIEGAPDDKPKDEDVIENIFKAARQYVSGLCACVTAVSTPGMHTIREHGLYALAYCGCFAPFLHQDNTGDGGAGRAGGRQEGAAHIPRCRCVRPLMPWQHSRALSPNDTLSALLGTNQHTQMGAAFVNHESRSEARTILRIFTVYG